MEHGWRRARSVALALAAALVFWVYIKLEQDYVAVLSVPLRIQLPPETALATPVPASVEVHVQATGWRLIGVELWNRPREMVVPIPEVPLPGVFGVGRVQMTRSLGLPSGVSLLHLSPDTLTLSLERAVVRSVPVVPELRAAVPQGFVLMGLHVEPESIQVRGAESVIPTFSAVRTAPVAIVPQSKELQVEAPVVLRSSAPVELFPMQVRVSVQLQPEAEICIEDVPVEIVPSPAVADHLAMPRYVRVWLRGPLEKVLAIAAHDLRATVPYTELLQDTVGRVGVQIVAPEGTEVFRVEPPWLLHWSVRRAHAR